MSRSFFRFDMIVPQEYGSQETHTVVAETRRGSGVENVRHSGDAADGAGMDANSDGWVK